MIEKIDNMNMVPDDIRELLTTDKGEFIPIGNDVYKIYPFGIKQHFELLAFISKYFGIYNEIFLTNGKNLDVFKFLGLLSEKLIESNILEDFFKKFFPELKNLENKLTQKQLEYLLGVIYKLNFLSKNLQIQNLEIRNSINRMKELLGLNLNPMK